MLPEEAWKVLNEADLVCDARTVRAAIERLGREISDRLANSNPIVLVVMRGALPFAGQLMPFLRFPLELDYVHATRYGNATSGGVLEWIVQPRETVRARSVLIVDDILDAGDTLAAIRARVLDLGAQRCLLAVLTEKKTDRPKKAVADFVGIELPDRYLFGCGLDVSGAWRNLPEIYALKNT
jgi:hypoxanthine phosphoribosyltransferase